jgi:hypothetical protein
LEKHVIPQRTPGTEALNKARILNCDPDSRLRGNDFIKGKLLEKSQSSRGESRDLKL